MTNCNPVTHDGKFEMKDKSKYGKIRCYIILNVSNKALGGKKDIYNFYQKKSSFSH